MLDSYMLGWPTADEVHSYVAPSRCCADTSDNALFRATRYNRRASVRLSYMGQAWRDRGLFGVTHERGPLQDLVDLGKLRAWMDDRAWRRPD